MELNGARHMTPKIPKWAYLCPPAGQVRYGQFVTSSAARGREQVDQRGDQHSEQREFEHVAVWSGSVPVWDASTRGLSDGDRNILIIRVRPEIELVLMSVTLADPSQLRHSLSKRLTPARWPMRSWYLSHLVYMTRVVKRPRPGKKATHRFCGGRLPDSRGKYQQLAFIALPHVPVTLVPSKKDRAVLWDIELRISRNPDGFMSWYSFVTYLATVEPWERELIFVALAHLMPLELIDMLEQTGGKILGRIQNIGEANIRAAFQVSDESRARASANPEEFVSMASLPENCSDSKREFLAVLSGMTRMPMPVVCAEGVDKISAAEALSSLSWFSPSAYTRRGDLLDPYAYNSRVAIDMKFDADTNNVLHRMAFLPPHFGSST